MRHLRPPKNLSSGSSSYSNEIDATKLFFRFLVLFFSLQERTKASFTLISRSLQSLGKSQMVRLGQLHGYFKQMLDQIRRRHWVLGEDDCWMRLFKQKEGLEVCLKSILMFNVFLYDSVRLVDACVLLKVNEKEVLSHQSTFFFIVISIRQCDVIIKVKYYSNISTAERYKTFILTLGE